MYIFNWFSLQSPYFACMFNGSWRESLLSEIDLQIPDPAIDNLGNTSEQTDMYEGRMVHMAVHSCMVFSRIHVHFTPYYVNWNYCSSEQHIPYDCNKCNFKSVLNFLNLLERINYFKNKENFIRTEFSFWESNHTSENRNSNSKQGWLR